MKDSFTKESGDVTSQNLREKKGDEIEAYIACEISQPITGMIRS